MKNINLDDLNPEDFRDSTPAAPVTFTPEADKPAARRGFILRIRKPVQGLTSPVEGTLKVGMYLTHPLAATGDLREQIAEALKLGAGQLLQYSLRAQRTKGILEAKLFAKREGHGKKKGRVEVRPDPTMTAGFQSLFTSGRTFGKMAAGPSPWPSYVAVMPTAQAASLGLETLEGQMHKMRLDRLEKLRAAMMNDPETPESVKAGEITDEMKEIVESSVYDAYGSSYAAAAALRQQGEAKSIVPLGDSRLMDAVHVKSPDAEDAKSISPQGPYHRWIIPTGVERPEDPGYVYTVGSATTHDARMLGQLHPELVDTFLGQIAEAGRQTRMFDRRKRAITDFLL